MKPTKQQMTDQFEVTSRNLPSHLVGEITQSKNEKPKKVQISVVEHIIKQLFVYGVPKFKVEIILQIIKLQLQLEDISHLLSFESLKNSEECDIPNVLKTLKVLERKGFLLPIQLEFFNTILYSEFNEKLNSSLQEIDEELDSLKGYQIELNITKTTGDRSITCLIIAESEFYQNKYKLALTIESLNISATNYPLQVIISCKESEQLTTNEIETIQFTIEQIIRAGTKTPFIDCVAFLQKYLEEKLELIKTELKKKKKSNVEIPFMPPLHELHELRPQTSGLQLQSFSINEIQNTLISMSKKAVKKMNLKLIQVENIFSPKLYFKFIKNLEEVRNIIII